jgi:tetratricopeptide (TPR) repeat protein
MIARIICFVAAFLSFGSWKASAQTLTIGDDAPVLEVSKWVKGNPIASLEKDRIYVLNFWSASNEVSKVSLPYLTQIQNAYKDKGVQCIGVGLMADNQDDIESFVKNLGDKIGYSMAVDRIADDGPGKMARNWVIASEYEGLQAAFIVQGGKIAWIGDSMDIDRDLALIVAGHYDVSKAGAEYRKEQAKRKKYMAFVREGLSLGPSPSLKERLALISKTLEESPELELGLGVSRMKLMFLAGDRQAIAYGTRLLEGTLRDEAEELNNLTWAILELDGRLTEPDRAHNLALKAALRANDLRRGQFGWFQDTLASIYFRMGEPKKALEAQEKAVKLMPDADPGMKDRLEQYRKAVKEKKP